MTSPAFQTGPVSRGLAQASSRIREEADDAPVTKADLLAAGRAQRARDMAIAACGRKHAAAERKDHRGARTARGEERRHVAEAEVQEERLAAVREERGDQRWAARTLEETIGLETARGEVVERRKSGGARIKTRDGLETLAFLDNGSAGITSVQYRAGLLYRDLHEGCREQLASQLGAIQGGTSRGPTPFDPDKETWTQRRMRLTAKREAIHDEIRVATRDLTCITLLQAVAGEGSSISQLRASGSAKVKASAQLRLALDVVARHFGVSDDRVKVQTAGFDTAGSCAYGDRPDEPDEQ